MTVSPTLDKRNAVEALVPFSGGRIELTLASGVGYTLDIPGGALYGDEKITMTPITRIDGMGLSGGLIGGVQLEPDGLQLAIPAALTISIPKGYDQDMTMVGIGYKGAGEDFRLEFAKGDGKTITLPIFSFSGHGAGSGTPEEVHNHISISQTDLINDQYLQNQNLCLGVKNNCEPLADYLIKYYKKYLKPGFIEAIKNKDEAAIDKLMVEDVTWMQVVKLTGLEYWKLLGEPVFASLLEDGERYIKLGSQTNFNIDAERCVNESDITMVGKMMGRLKVIALFANGQDNGYDISSSWTWKKFEKCMRYRMEVTSSMEWKWGDGLTVFMIVKGRMLFRLEDMSYSKYVGTGTLYYETFSAIFSGEAEKLNQYCSIETAGSAGKLRGVLTLGPPREWVKVPVKLPDGTVIYSPALVIPPGRENDLEPQAYIFPNNMQQALPKWKCANVTVPAASQMPLWWTGFFKLHESQYIPNFGDYGDVFSFEGFTTSDLQRREADFNKSYDKDEGTAKVHEELSFSIRFAPGAKD